MRRARPPGKRWAGRGAAMPEGVGKWGSQATAAAPASGGKRGEGGRAGGGEDTPPRLIATAGAACAGIGAVGRARGVYRWDKRECVCVCVRACVFARARACKGLSGLSAVQ